MMTLTTSLYEILLFVCLTWYAQAITKSNGNILLGYSLQFSSVEELANNTFLYQIEVKVTDGFDKNCKFRGTGIRSKNTTVNGDMVLGRLLSDGQVQPSFFCKTPGSHITSNFSFRKFIFPVNKKTIFRVYDGAVCNLAAPNHFTTEYLRIMSMKLSCSNFQLSTTTLKTSIDGFLFRNGSIMSLPYDFFETKTVVNVNGEMEILVTSKRSEAQPGSVLLDFSFTLSQLDKGSPVETIRFKYYYPKSLNGQYPALARDALGFLDTTSSHKYVSKDQEVNVACFVGGYPYFIATIMKDGTPLQGLEEKVVGLYGEPYIKYLGYSLPYVNESTMGNYTCLLRNGEQTLHSSTIISICREPTVKFSFTDNETQTTAIFRTESTSLFTCFIYNEVYEPIPILPKADANGNMLVLYNRTGNYNKGTLEITWRDVGKAQVPDVIMCHISNVCTERKERAFPMKKTLI